MEKSAEYISRYIEKHANIGNHLMTALCALYLYCDKLDNTNKQISDGINLILTKLKSIWNDEGWFEEYVASDIGYLTLTLQYLSRIDSTNLKEKDIWTEKIINFLIHFFHKDGSIGNYYGSRGSSIIYPAGLVKSGFKEIKISLIESINKNKIPSPQDLDDTSFVPCFNSFVQSFIEMNKTNSKKIELPMHKDGYLKIFKNAGFIITSNNNNQNIIDLKNGGSISTFSDSDAIRQGSSAIVHKNKKEIYRAINSMYEISNENHLKINVYGNFYKTNTDSIGIVETIFSRLFIPLISNFPSLFNIVKSFIARKYFVPSNHKGSFKKDILINNFEVSSTITTKIPKDFTFIENHKEHPIRMASQNYL